MAKTEIGLDVYSEIKAFQEEGKNSLEILKKVFDRENKLSIGDVNRVMASESWEEFTGKVETVSHDLGESDNIGVTTRVQSRILEDNVRAKWGMIYLLEMRLGILNDEISRKESYLRKISGFVSNYDK